MPSGQSVRWNVRSICGTVRTAWRRSSSRVPGPGEQERYRTAEVRNARALVAAVSAAEF